MNVSTGHRCQKCFNYVVVVCAWTDDEECLHLLSLFYVPILVYAGTLPAGGFVLVHRIHNTTDSGYSANVHADSPLCAVLLSCFFFYGDTTLKLMASSKLLWSLLAITMLSFLSCLLSVVVCHHYYYYYHHSSFLLYSSSSCCCCCCCYYCCHLSLHPL